MQRIIPKLVVKCINFFKWKFPDTSNLSPFQLKCLAEVGKTILEAPETQADFDFLVDFCVDTIYKDGLVDDFNKEYDSDKDKLWLPKNKKELTKYAVLFLLSRYPNFERRIIL